MASCWILSLSSFETRDRIRVTLMEHYPLHLIPEQAVPSEPADNFLESQPFNLIIFYLENLLLALP